ncbi:MAG: hypothetical protein M3P43_11670 [Actinomycetota bacterium]|nr:hypothetical protein [Actinomycetota bacterium]
MRKRLPIGIIVSLVAALGLWFGLGSATAKPDVAVKAHHVVTAKATHARATHARATRRLSKSSAALSSERPASAALSSESPEGTSESESNTPETDNVDCQQEGNFDGVNAAGTGPGCDGSGT